MFGLKKWRRNRIRSRPFPEDWSAVIRRNVPYVGRLSDDQRTLLEELVQIFVHEKSFEGCGGLEINDEIKVTIAAQACILILGHADHIYPGLRTILVYPHAFRARFKSYQPDGSVIEGTQTRLGESWSRGAVILSWNDVIKGASDMHDGSNLVFHEFAHQLDYDSGATEGLDTFSKLSSYIPWARMLSREYQQLLQEIKKKHQPLLDAYGAKNPAEFFAVATEYFFEKPVQLKKQHPELYQQLSWFYQQDPGQLLNKPASPEPSS